MWYLIDKILAKIDVSISTAHYVCLLYCNKSNSIRLIHIYTHMYTYFTKQIHKILLYNNITLVVNIHLVLQKY